MAKQTFTTGQVLTAAQMTSLQQTAMGGGSATAKTANYVLVAADAGTTIIMNAAGATTITVNTSLFSSGDTVFIQNIGAGTCTVTAGTATVSTAGSLALTQYEGGTLYFTATGAAIFNDYVQASGSASALTKLYAQPFTTSSQIDVDDVFSATYENYLLMINVSASSSSDYVKVRMRVGGSTNSDSTYFWSWMSNASSYPAYDSQGGSAANGFQTFYRDTGQNAYMGIMQMNNPYLSLRTSTNWQWSAMSGSSYNISQQGGGVFNANTSFTGFSIVPGSGTLTGKVAVYGYSI